MVLLVMSIAATLAAPAFSRLGSDQPRGAADALTTLLRSTRRVAVDHNATATLRLDPQSLRYRVDTSGTDGAGTFILGRLDLGLSQTLATDQPRLRYVFGPTGSAFADTVIVRGSDVPWIVRVDAWSGIARADSR